MRPIHHVAGRLVLAMFLAAAAKGLAARWDVILPLGITFNIGLTLFFLFFWFWPFPWAEVMLLSQLEQAQRKLLPHSGTRLAAGDCTIDDCALAGTNRAKCIRIRYMKEQTKKREDRLGDSVFRSGAPYFLTILGITIAVQATIGVHPVAPEIWQVIQALGGLLSVTWWLGIIYAEVNYQRSLNYELLL